MDLALADQVVEGAQGLLERGEDVVAVGLEEIHVIGLEARCSEDSTDSMMCLRDSPLLLGLGPVRQYTLVKISMESRAVPLSARPSTDSAMPEGVDVGRVEGRDAVLERGLHAGEGGVLLDLAAVGDPVAVREGGDVHARAAEVSIVHGPGA